MINWPIIIKHDGEDELIYVGSFSQWQNDEEMLLYIFTDRDVLIDSIGQVFSLTDVQQSTANDQQLDPRKCLAVATINNVMELIRSHASLTGQCCIEKMHAQTFEQAFDIVKQLQD